MRYGNVHRIRARKNYTKWYKCVRGEESTEGGMSRIHLDLPAGKEGFERGK
jgi:hypothetical protein